MTDHENKDLSPMTGTAGTIDFSDMDAICAELAGTLACPDRDAPMLRRQAEMLDQLLCIVMKDSVRKVTRYKNFYDARDNLDLALRIQKQCTDTIKAEAAIEYMQAIAPRAEPPVPLPLYNDEQSEGW